MREREREREKERKRERKRERDKRVPIAKLRMAELNSLV